MPVAGRVFSVKTPLTQYGLLMERMVKRQCACK